MRQSLSRRTTSGKLGYLTTHREVGLLINVSRRVQPRTTEQLSRINNALLRPLAGAQTTEAGQGSAQNPHVIHWAQRPFSIG
jgi:hypothetical protein